MQSRKNGNKYLGYRIVVIILERKERRIHQHGTEEWRLSVPAMSDEVLEHRTGAR